jgi:SAM-dependent methyltransferase
MTIMSRLQANAAASMPPPVSSYRDSHVGKGEDYQRRFASCSFRRITWQWEQRLLPAIVQAQLPPGRRRRYLDFACGTGRILALLEPHFDEALGVDVSPTMLATARESCRSRVLQADLTAASHESNELAAFDLITAFRFFPNAEPALRLAAMQRLAALLAPGGKLVFNNHQNDGSLTGQLRRLRRRLGGGSMLPWMREADVLELVQAAGLRIAQRHHFGVVPGTEHRTLLPAALQYGVERLLERVPALGRMATCHVYVCERP